VIVEPAGIVHERPGQVMFNGLVDRPEVGQDRLDSRTDQMLLCSHPHPARNENGDAGQWRGHCSVFMTLMVVTFMAALAVRPFPPGMMAGLVYPVSFHDLSILKTYNLVVECPPEMGADRDTIVGDKCKYASFHIHDHAFL
jgi:hypothetical protein